MSRSAHAVCLREPLRFAALLVCAWLCALLIVAAQAASIERYEYDGLGRLVRVIDGANRVTEYRYDAAGNITAVVSGGTAQAPTVTGLTPNAVRRGTTTSVTLTGTQLENAALTVADPALDITRVTRTPTTITFDLVVGATATLGPASIQVGSAAGNASATINIRPLLPQAQVVPLPIAVAPGGAPSAYDLTLSAADDVSHTFALTMTRTDLATASPSEVTIAAGQTSARFTVRGLAGGNTELRLVSATLGTLQVPVFVTATPEGITTARASSVGVVLERPPGPAAERPVLFASPIVGVTFGGSAWVDTQPRTLPQGTTQTVRLLGTGLPADVTVAIEPAAGLTIGPVAVAADGAQASFDVTVAAGAAMGLRTLAVTGGGRRLSPASSGADEIDVVAPRPEISSVTPILVQTGTTIAQFEIRGRNLQDVHTIELRGAAGITPGATLTASADGTRLLLALHISNVAEPGARTVVVRAPAGASSETPVPANTLTVADAFGQLQSYPEVASAIVGVEVARPVTPVERAEAQTSPAVGVVLGPIVTGLTPTSIARGETRRITVAGESLQGVDAITLVPADGLTVSAITPSGDGRSLAFDLTASASAPLSARRVIVRAGAVSIDTAERNAPSVLVTPVAPIIESIEPAGVAAGSTFELLLRGRNFQNATAVRITPSAGITIGPVTVNADGTRATANVSVQAAAAVGPRVVSLVAPAGETSTTPGPTNVLTIGTAPVTFRDLAAATVGVQVGDPPPPPSAPPLNATLAAPLVGVQVGEVAGDDRNRVFVYSPPVGVEIAFTPAPVTSERHATSSPAGVVVGPAVLAVQPPALLRGQTAEILVQGHALPAGASVRVFPEGHVTPQGSAVLEPGGTVLRQTVAVSATAPIQSYQVRVSGPGESFVPAASANAAVLQVIARLPEVVSLEPILAVQGDTLNLLIRGVGLAGITRISAEPAAGIDFGASFTVNAAGTEITVPLSVRADAPPGARTIRVFNAAGGSSAAASPANTFTVYTRE